MHVRTKIQTRPDMLEIHVTAGAHLRSAQGMIAVPTTIFSIAKVWRALAAENRDFVNVARGALAGEKEGR